MVCQVHEGIKAEYGDHTEAGFWDIRIDFVCTSKYLVYESYMIVKVIQRKCICGGSVDRLLWGNKRSINIPNIPISYAPVLGINQESLKKWTFYGESLGGGSKDKLETSVTY